MIYDEEEHPYQGDHKEMYSMGLYNAMDDISRFKYMERNSKLRVFF